MTIPLLLGTSGWTYDHWKDVFYPSGIPKKKWFEYYTSKFDTVELNASFYRIPTEKAVQSWSDRSPPDFRFSIKMSRLITHVKKLKNCIEELQWFFSVLKPLKSKICTILVQLPPTMKFDIFRLKEFFDLLPENYTFVFEFRNPTWYKIETYELLLQYNHHFCIHDMAGIATDRIVLSNLAYLRFHGFESNYGGDYPEAILKVWAQWLAIQHREHVSVYGYFNNDIGGMAVRNCLQLKKLVLQEIL